MHCNKVKNEILSENNNLAILPITSTAVCIMVYYICTYIYIECFSVFPESARWLAVKGRLQEAEAVISHLARVNGRQKPKDTLERLQEVMEEELKAGQGRRYTYIDVYRGWRMAVTSLAINFIW